MLPGNSTHDDNDDIEYYDNCSAKYLSD